MFHLGTPILARLQVGMGAKHFPAIAAPGKGVYDGALIRCKKRPPLLESKAFARPTSPGAVEESASHHILKASFFTTSPQHDIDILKSFSKIICFRIYFIYRSNRVSVERSRSFTFPNSFQEKLAYLHCHF